MLQHEVEKKGKKHKTWIASGALYSISVLKTELFFIPFQF